MNMSRLTISRVVAMKQRVKVRAFQRLRAWYGACMGSCLAPGTATLVVVYEVSM
jgi:hypothetical protein